MKELIRQKTFLYLVLFSALLNMSINNGELSLWDQDESAYAGFAYTMIKTGNWVVPDFLWSEPHRKTPFHFWSIALSFWVFGVREFALRVPSVLAVIFTCWGVFALGKRVFGREQSLTAVLLILCSFFLPSLAKVSVTDASLILFETLAALFIINQMHAPSWRWALGLWGAVALGMLVKGPPVLIQTFGMIGLLFIFHKNRWRLIGLHPWFGLPLAVVPLWLWGRAAWLSDGGVFINWLLDWYIFKRASGETAFGQWGPPGYFLAVFFLSFLPWAVLFPKALGDFFKGIFKKERSDFYLYMGAWILPGWFFYELIPSKLPSYAMGAYGAVALLLADQLLKLKPEDIKEMKILRVGLYLYAGFAVLITAALPVAAYLLLDAYGLTVASITAAIWAVLSFFTFNQYRRGDLRRAAAGSAVSSLMFVLLVWGFVIPSFEFPRSATKRIAERIEQSVSKETKVVFARPFYLPSLPFYVGLTGRSYQSVSEEEFDKVKEMFLSDTPYVFVFDQQKYDLFLQAMEGETGKKLPKPMIVAGWVSDMGKWIEYKIVSNK